MHGGRPAGRPGRGRRDTPVSPLHIGPYGAASAHASQPRHQRSRQPDRARLRPATVSYEHPTWTDGYRARHRTARPGRPGLLDSAYGAGYAAHTAAFCQIFYTLKTLTSCVNSAQNRKLVSWTRPRSQPPGPTRQVNRPRPPTLRSGPGLSSWARTRPFPPAGIRLRRRRTRSPRTLRSSPTNYP
jgi:hypothetical protein